jgi:hypothetical protein
VVPHAYLFCDLPNKGADTMQLQLLARTLMCLRGVKLLVAIPLTLAATSISSPLPAAEVLANNKSQSVIFVCKYGSMKSQMAAAYFNREAQAHGLHFSAISRAFTPDKEIPQMIIENMAKEGLAPTNGIITLTPQEAVDATRVISFDEIPNGNIGDTKYTYWSGSPLSKSDYWGAMSFIKQHVDDEIAKMVTQQNASR